MKFMTEDLPPFVRALLKPAAYPHAADRIKLVQTHISYVLLAGDFAYKFKKPVDFGFLNFTTLEKRRFYCEQELLLNRRLCPEIYLGLVSVNRTTADLGFTLGGNGQPFEYGVKMARMPEERMMGNIIRAGLLDQEMIDKIVTVLEPFYAGAATGPTIESFCTAAAVGANVLGNLEQCRPYIGCDALRREEYAEIEKYLKDFLRNEKLFAGRIDAGRSKDCHGDLHSANICLADRVYIYDCIEFNQSFRYSDIANDVAFLAMDMDYYYHEELSDYFINRLVSDAGDQGLLAMLNFYKCYRATVRGKIGLLTAHEPEIDEAARAEARTRASRYFLLAQRYAETG